MVTATAVVMARDLREPIDVACPECEMPPGSPCVYTWPKQLDRAYVELKGPWLSDKQRALVDRVGQETKRPHNQRFQELDRRIRQREWARRTRADRRQILAATAASAGRRTIARTLQAFDLAEHERLRAWLAEHAHLLTDPVVEQDMTSTNGQPASDDQPAGDVVFTLTVRDGNIVEIRSREGRTAADFADTLREIADSFASGDVRRVG